MTRLVRGLSDMRMYRPLHQAMHDRLPHSAAVRKAHNTFLAWIVEMIDEVVAEPGSDVDRIMVRDIAVAVFEGAHVPNDHGRPAHEMLRYLMESVFSQPLSSGRTAATVSRPRKSA